MIDGTITDRKITERLLSNSGYHFQMSAEGNGTKIVSSAGGASFMDQDKWGNLDYEVIDGVRTNQSSHHSLAKIEGVGDSRSSGGTSDTTHYRMTRFFNQSENPNNFQLSQYTQTAQSFGTSQDGRTGFGTHEEASSTTHLVNGNGEADPGQTLETSQDMLLYVTHPDGSISGISDHSDSNLPETMSGSQANDFAAFVPTPPLFDPTAMVTSMLNYTGGGNWSIVRPNFIDNGSSEDAPDPTGPPISTGTEPDGTYWEFYNNGDVWIKRTFVSEGGELIREDWGHHTETLFGLMKDFNQLIEDFSEGTVIESIDEFFADLIEVGGVLNEKNNTPKIVREETLTDIKNRIRNLRKLRQAVQLPLIYSKAVTEEIKKLVSDYQAAGGDIKDLSINGAPSSPEEQQIEALRKKVRELIKNFNPQKISPDIVKDLVDSGLAEETADGNAVIIRSGDRVIVLQLHKVKQYSDVTSDLYGTGVQTVTGIDRFYSIKEILPRWLTSDKSEEISTETAGQGVELQLEIGERQTREMQLTILLNLLPGGAAALEYQDNGLTAEFWISAGADALLLGAAVVKYGKVGLKIANQVHNRDFPYGLSLEPIQTRSLHDYNDTTSPRLIRSDFSPFSCPSRA